MTNKETTFIKGGKIPKSFSTEKQNHSHRPKHHVLKSYINVPEQDFSNSEFPSDGIDNLSIFTLKEKCFENIPRTIKLCGLAQKWQRAGDRYKFIVEVDGLQGHYVLEEDILVETLLNSGMNSDNIFNDKFILANYSGNLKLIRYDSQLHKSIKLKEKQNSRSLVRFKELERGRLYKTRGGKLGIYLGCACATRYIPEYYSNGTLKKFDKKIIKNTTLWCDIPSYAIKNGELTNEGLQRFFDESLNSNFSSYIVLKKQHSFIEQLEYKIEIPNMIISEISNKYYKKMLGYVDRVKNQNNAHPMIKARLAYGSYDVKSVIEYICTMSENFTMTFYGADPTFGERNDLFDKLKELTNA